MNKLIVLLCIAIAGCATSPVSPANAPIPSAKAASPAEPVAALPPEKEVVSAAPTPPVAEPVRTDVQPATQQPGEAEKKTQEASPAGEASQPEKQKNIPLTASRQPEPTVPEQSKPPVMSELAVPEHKWQSLADLAASNDDKIMSVFVGMYRKTVDTIMGSDHNPYKRRTIMGTEGEAYDVVFYLTREPRKGKGITDRMLTPVIFKKGRVVALGNYQLKKLIRIGTLERPKLSKAQR